MFNPKYSIMLICLLLPACVTRSSRNPKTPLSKPFIEKQDDAHDKAGSRHMDQNDVGARPVPSVEEQEHFLKRHTTPGVEFTRTDHDFVSALPSDPEPGSITEAALAVGLIKTILSPLNMEPPTFEEVDIGDTEKSKRSPSPSPAGGLSLEELTEERGVNLPDALVENRFLISYGVAKQTLQALAISRDSKDFREELMVSLRRHAENWVSLAPALGVVGDGPAKTGKPTDRPAVQNGMPQTPPNTGDLRGGEALLAEAQAFADRGNFRDAIKQAERISEESPLYDTAQEKIMEFSNRAVQDLRRKAAEAFQSALPLTDSRARAQYLRKAKTYLEEALNNYPKAAQLPTVRDNLRVISRDLERLESEQG